MQTTWKLQDAKNRLSQVVKQATHLGPQVITVHGRKTAVLLAYDDYRSISRRKGSLVEFLQDSPMHGQVSASIEEADR